MNLMVVLCKIYLFFYDSDFRCVRTAAQLSVCTLVSASLMVPGEMRRETSETVINLIGSDSMKQSGSTI